MAQKENIIWDILELLFGHNITMSQQQRDQDPVKSRVENAYSIGGLKGELVLRHSPQDIEDTIYFMKNREYLVEHGYGMMGPAMACSLSEKAIKVWKEKLLPAEEQTAFKESLWDINPKLYGIGPNWKEMTRRLRKLVKN